jgi:hypothetical protein
MKPSEYVTRYGEHMDIHSLENILWVYKYHNYILAPDKDVLRRQFSQRGLFLNDPDGEIMVEEYDREVKLANDTLAAWRKELAERQADE